MAVIVCLAVRIFQSSNTRRGLQTTLQCIFIFGNGFVHEILLSTSVKSFVIQLKIFPSFDIVTLEIPLRMTIEPPTIGRSIWNVSFQKSNGPTIRGTSSLVAL
jgi:hypothetical protein